MWRTLWWAGKEHDAKAWGVRVEGAGPLVYRRTGEDSVATAQAGVSKETGEGFAVAKAQRSCTQMSLSRCPALTGHLGNKKREKALEVLFKLSTKVMFTSVLVQA